MKFTPNDPNAPVPFLRPPRFHRDLFETMLLAAANDNLASGLLPLAPDVAECCYVAADLLESILERRR